jgi:predicted DNA-binding protein (MmcQ/YjbR family)
MDIEFLRKICLSFPAAGEDVKWQHDLVFSIGGKMFCVASLEPPFRCSFKVKDEEFEELTSRDGFIPAPYMARAKWVQVTNPAIVSKKEWNSYLQQSYNLVKSRLSKKERLSLGIN